MHPVPVGGNSGHQEQALCIEKAESTESRTLDNCTTSLETAFTGMEKEFVHFLQGEGFITEMVHNKILNPVTVLTEEDKAGEVVKWIKKRVKQDYRSYLVLLSHMTRYENRYRPILNTLGNEYVKQCKRNPQGLN
jgi:hypothetical protein